MTKLLLLVSHALALGVGFALGVYFLPVLIAPQQTLTNIWCEDQLHPT